MSPSLNTQTHLGALTPAPPSELPPAYALGAHSPLLRCSAERLWAAQLCFWAAPRPSPLAPWPSHLEPNLHLGWAQTSDFSVPAPWSPAREIPTHVVLGDPAHPAGHTQASPPKTEPFGSFPSLSTNPPLLAPASSPSTNARGSSPPAPGGAAANPRDSGFSFLLWSGTCLLLPLPLSGLQREAGSLLLPEGLPRQPVRVCPVPSPSLRLGSTKRPPRLTSSISTQTGASLIPNPSRISSSFLLKNIFY